MIVSAWNNGSQHPSGAGYGLKIALSDRDCHFKREWRSIILELEGKPSPVEVNINKEPFWGNTCRELISLGIGKWLYQTGLAPWPKGYSPKLLLKPLGNNRFSLKQMIDE